MRPLATRAKCSQANLEQDLVAGALCSHVSRRHGQVVRLGRRRRRPTRFVLPNNGLRLWRRLCCLLCWRCLVCLLGLVVSRLLPPLLLLLLLLPLLRLLLRLLRRRRGGCLLHANVHTSWCSAAS
jgi:Flp pilus assembly protein TadB